MCESAIGSEVRGAVGERPAVGGRDMRGAVSEPHWQLAAEADGRLGRLACGPDPQRATRVGRHKICTDARARVGQDGEQGL